MKWVIELALSAMVVGLVFYVVSVAAPAPVYIAAEREVTANAYFILLRLTADPHFMSALERAMCQNDAEAVAAMLNVTIPLRYYYNFTVYLDDERPPSCLACARWSQKLVSAARPRGLPQSGAGVAAVSALLSDGTRVRLTLSLDRP